MSDPPGPTPSLDHQPAQKFNPNHDELGRFTTGDGAADPSGRPQLAQGRRLFGPRRPVPIPPGTTIRNKDLAGKKHPDTGIPFDSQGFPDFSSVTKDTATFPHTGDADKDRAAANRQKGYAKTPDGWVWHHHQDGHRMQLVPEDIHTKTGHTGSRGIRNLPGKK